MKKKVMLVFGTRPEAIKMCPLVNELKTRDSLETVVCVTGQHRQMLDQVLETFNVVTMPPAAAQMMMKAVSFLLLVYISLQFVVSLFWRHQYTTEHVVTPGDPEPGMLSVAATLPAQMIGAFKPVYL